MEYEGEMSVSQMEQQWAEVGQRLDELEQLLLAVPDCSMHALQAHDIINKVRACKEQWPGWGKERSAGRPPAVFFKRGDEASFCRCLSELLDAQLARDGKSVALGDAVVVKVAKFFALLYDVCVQVGIASGVDDLMAYYNIIKPLAQKSLGEVTFTMAYKTLNKEVDDWAQFVPENRDRVFLHRISMKDVGLRILSQQLSAEKAKQQKVAELARKYKVIPEIKNG